jgi:type VI secretion system protein ImpA
MSVLDVESLLSPVSSEAPCGENLEYDADYAAMEQAAAGKPEQQFGKTTIPGEEPDWKEVCAKARELFSRTKDLRVGMYLVRGATWTEGLAGLADGMQVLAGLVEQHWDGVHPQLDPDDDNDPTLRLNTIASLTDPATMLRAVQIATLVSPRGMGKVCYRDVQVAAGELPQLAGTERIETSTIDGAFAACEPGELKATAQAVKKALERTRSLESALVDRVGVSNVPELDAFSGMLVGMNKLLEQKLAARGLLDEEEPAVAADAESDGAENVDGNGHAGAGATNGRRVAMAANATGDISSREDVIRALDRICDYYKRYEPSSPVPLFLNRAKRLASKSFLEILRDLTPDAVNQALAIGGITDGAAASAGVDENDV